jgi:hypothetical protein
MNTCADEDGNFPIPKHKDLPKKPEKSGPKREIYKKLQEEVILEEDDYLAGLERIITRDFFPELWKIEQERKPRT